MFVIEFLVEEEAHSSESERNGKDARTRSVLFVNHLNEVHIDVGGTSVLRGVACTGPASDT